MSRFRFTGMFHKELQRTLKTNTFSSNALFEVVLTNESGYICVETYYVDSMPPASTESTIESFVIKHDDISSTERFGNV